MQAERTLEEYLRRRGAAPDALRIRAHWEERRRRYLNDVRTLFEQIKGWLKPLGNQVSIAEGTTTVTEENLQTYEVPELTIFLADQPVVMRPVGTNIFGSFGRIDLMGKNGVVSIVLTDWDRWQFLRQEYAASLSARFTDVSETEFKNALRLLIAD